MNRRSPVYPVFLPFAGCPYQCIYCDQHAVTAVSGHRSPLQAAKHQIMALAKRASASGQRGEIAFYGGTFTALPPHIMTQLLQAATEYVREALFIGIRFSTRPDCLNRHVLRLLADYPVTTVELGIQSLSDAVLRASRRGYSRDQALEAISQIHENGWNLGVQLMVGLPDDTPEQFLHTVSGIIATDPNFVRLYPVLVFPATELEQWTNTGRYQPLSVEQALAWCVPAFDALVRAGIPVARLSLMISGGSSPSTVIAAGPWHPAFGQLVRSGWWRQRVDAALAPEAQHLEQGSVTVQVARRHVSDVHGWKRQNLTHWHERWRLNRVRVEGTGDNDSIDFSVVIDGRASTAQSAEPN